jgi:rSAM/selenodomain-associated transferase 2
VARSFAFFRKSRDARVRVQDHPQPHQIMPFLSVIVPMLDEEHAIATTLAAIRAGAPEAEVIVVDGGSTDSSVTTARLYADQLLPSDRGRARQMNTGAAAASGAALVFVHADTTVPHSFGEDIVRALSDPTVVGGRFDVTLDDPSLPCRAIGRLISLRSRISRTASGDQAIFVRREIFESLGGFPLLDICEDLDFSRRLKRAGKVACLRTCVTTSARRWRRDGLLKTTLRMWTIRALYLLGVPTLRLKSMWSNPR